MCSVLRYGAPRLIDRFWSKVRKTDGCWYWEGALNDCGYGRVRACGKLRAAHRIAYALSVGPVPSNVQVRQACGERTCCRPDHLYLFQAPRLTPEQVQAIKRCLLGCRRLSSLYGVSAQRIKAIRRSQATLYGV